jgi:PleD family two-component response regulator
MARAVLLTADLLFGSNVQGMLAAAGNEVEVASGPTALHDALVRQPAEVVIVDLTDDQLEGVQIVTELREEGLLDGAPVLAYYSHVEPGVRDLAIAEGFDLVVPRSRMAREAAALVGGLVGGQPG